MLATAELPADVARAPVCQALGLSRATLHRRCRPTLRRAAKRPSPPRALATEERATVLAALHGERFVDKAPAQVWAELLDEGTYHCSIRTMYRILAEAGEVRERRDQLRHPSYQKPELLATGPNQVWSWDITKLLGPVKWTYFYLYVLLDIYSRFVVGWMVASKEAAALAQRLIEESCRQQKIAPGQLVVHSDRGSSMTSQPVALLLAELGVIKSHSRPHVSNDNPFSEAQFKTLKYCPQFPDRFGSIEHARSFCRGFFPFYNSEHRHSALGLMTPESVHYGTAPQVRAARREVLLAAYAAHPERFTRPPEPPTLPAAAWINPPPKETALQDAPGGSRVTEAYPEVPPVFASAPSHGAELPPAMLAAEAQ